MQQNIRIVRHVGAQIIQRLPLCYFVPAFNFVAKGCKAKNLIYKPFSVVSKIFEQNSFFEQVKTVTSTPRDIVILPIPNIVSRLAFPLQLV